MDNTLIEVSGRGLSLVPVVIACVAIAKMYVDSYWAPLMSVSCGAALASVAGGITFLDSPILGGIVVGLMASGLYSGVAKMYNA